jgi:hydrogenase expression/formation protein HypC
MKLVSIDGPRGQADVGGVKRSVALDLVPDARVGDYVIVHAGYAIQTLDEEAAAETIALLKEVGAFDPEGVGHDP